MDGLVAFYGIKYLVGPLSLLGYIAFDLFGVGQTINAILNIAALAALGAGFLVLARLRAENAAAAGAAEAWKLERDAAVATKDRILEENSELRVRVAALEARPNLDTLLEEVQKVGKLVLAAQQASGTPPN